MTNPIVIVILCNYRSIQYNFFICFYEEKFYGDFWLTRSLVFLVIPLDSKGITQYQFSTSHVILQYTKRPK